MDISEFDVLIVGAGIAGASLAAQLADKRRVAILEREAQPGYHSTGRSAALFSETYGNDVVRALSRASREFLFSPPPGFVDYPLVRQRGTLHIAREDQLNLIDAFMALPDIAENARRVDAEFARKVCPILRAGYAAAAVHEPKASDVDVHNLHQGYLKMMRGMGGELILNAAVERLERKDGLWHAHTAAGVFAAPVAVNAAGAWADMLAQMAGVEPMGIVPHRRTALLVDPPQGARIDDLPNTIDIAELFYFKPDAGLLFLSPADETPSPPCDAQPEEMDIAIAIDRIQAAVDLDVRRVRRKWAGLRSFAPDRSPVIGFDSEADGFFWLAGQGGYGIQTAPGACKLAAALILGEGLPSDLRDFGVMLEALVPSRFAVSA